MTGQGFCCFRGKPGQLQTADLGHIGGHDTGPAGIGHNGDALSPGKFFGGKGAGIIKQFVYRLNPDDAGFGEDGVINAFRSGD